jgi:hypothetical protein
MEKGEAEKSSFSHLSPSFLSLSTMHEAVFTKQFFQNSSDSSRKLSCAKRSLNVHVVQVIVH